MKLLIIGANGRIARLVEQRILTDKTYENIDLTLLLRNKSRLAELENSSRVTLIEGDTSQLELLKTLMSDADMVYVAFTDDFKTATSNIIEAAKDVNLTCILSTSSIGLLNEEPNPDFAQWNQKAMTKILPGLRDSQARYEKSNLNYVIMRFGALNDNDEIQYKITKSDEKFAGTGVSRKSVADAILKIITDPQSYKNQILGISDPSTKDIKSYDYGF